MYFKGTSEEDSDSDGRMASGSRKRKTVKPRSIAVKKAKYVSCSEQSSSNDEVSLFWNF